MATRSAIINVMSRAADKAARGLRRDFGEVEHLQVSMKGPANFVSAADLKAERVLREELLRARPAYGLLMEEGGQTAGEDPHHRWIVDPLDGTTNFLHGLPHFAISIALEREGEIVAGLILDPLKDEMFWAEKGGGAFLNDHRLRVSSRRNLDQAVIATGFASRAQAERQTFMAQLDAAMGATAGVRRFGSASLDLAYVAAGRYDGFWESGLSPWDIAAGILIVREAGGYVTEIGGGANMMTSGSILAANDRLHAPIGRLLRDATAPGPARESAR